MNYQQWLKRTVEFFDTLGKFEGVQAEARVLPAVSQSDFDKATSELRWPLPPQVRDFYTSACNGCTCAYRWSIPPMLSQRLLPVFPKGVPPFVGRLVIEYSGELSRLTEQCTTFASAWVGKFAVDAKMWGHTIPLFDAGCGDYFGLYLEDGADNPPVAFLNHEGYDGSWIVSPSFDSFLSCLELLFYPTFSVLAHFINPQTGLIDVDKYANEVALFRRVLNEASGGVLLK
jgi:hypothetical protein